MKETPIIMSGDHPKKILDKLKIYQGKIALAEANYRTRLDEVERMEREASTIYQDDLNKALEEYQI